MRTYTKSLDTYTKLLADTRKDIEDSKLEMQDFLSSNTGNRTTREVNNLIMVKLNNMAVLGYNERLYEVVVDELTRGVAISKK